MPRIATTLGSLLLIACSLGINIARYPSVGGGLTMLPDMRAASSPLENPSVPTPPPASNATTAFPMAAGGLVERPASPPAPPAPAAVPPITAVASAAPPEVRGPVSPAEVDQCQPVGRILGVRPIFQTAGLTNPLVATDTGVSALRRLPPVDRNAFSPTVPTGLAADYPATATP